MRTPTASVEELNFTVDLSDLRQLRCWELVGNKKCQASTLGLFCFLGACGPPPDTACFPRCPTGTSWLLSVHCIAITVEPSTPQNFWGGHINAE